MPQVKGYPVLRSPLLAEARKFNLTAFMLAVLMILAGGHMWAVTSKGVFAGEVRERICVMWSASSCDQASALRQAALALFIAGLALSVVVGVAVAVHDWPALERTAAADRKLQRGPYMPYSQALLGWFLLQCFGLGITTMAIWQISHAADQVWQEGFYFALVRNSEIILLAGCIAVQPIVALFVRACIAAPKTQTSKSSSSLTNPRNTE